MARPRKNKEHDPFAVENLSVDSSLIFDTPEEQEIELPDFTQESTAKEDKPVLPSIYAKKGQPKKPRGQSEAPVTFAVEDSLEDLTAAPRSYKASKDIKASGLMGKGVQEDMARIEEVQAEVIRKKGRYMPFSDDVPMAKLLFDPEEHRNANPYVASNGRMVNSIASRITGENGDLTHDLFAEVNGKSIRSEGGTVTRGILDTNAGKEGKINPAEHDNPKSEHFYVCVNKNCAHRENCLRYRMSDKRENKAVFFPDSCRADGIFIPLEGSGITGITPFGNLDRNHVSRPF